MTTLRLLQRSLPAFLCAGAVLFARSASAWGPEGHSIVAEIGYRSLTPAARAEVDRIAAHEKIYDYEFASWPDIIRGNAEWKEKYPNNSKWHFIDLDVFAHTDTFTFDDENTIVAAIPRFSRELASHTLDFDRERDALRFLVHFVGDIHQPFHCVHRNNDVGGNMIPVNSFQGRFYAWEPGVPRDYPASIHSTWDECLVYEVMANRTDHQTTADLIQEITDTDRYYWSHSDTARWAIDCFWIAKKYAYRWQDGKQLPFTWKRPGMDLTRENYIDSRAPIVHTQLKKAGVRLGHILNETFDPDYQPPAKPAPKSTEESVSAE